MVVHMITCMPSAEIRNFHNNFWMSTGEFHCKLTDVEQFAAIVIEQSWVHSAQRVPFLFLKQQLKRVFPLRRG